MVGLTHYGGITEMLQATPRGWFSWNFVLSDGEEEIADIRLAMLREAGELVVDGKTYRVNREAIMSGAFVLTKDSLELARAEKPSAFQRSFQVSQDGRSYTLGAESALRRRFVLKENGQLVGSVYPVSAFSRKCAVDLPAEIPLPVRVFMVWLVIILWKRDSDSAAAVATG
jgi:hypothetical protein